MTIVENSNKDDLSKIISETIEKNNNSETNSSWKGDSSENIPEEIEHNNNNKNKNVLINVICAPDLTT